MHREHQAEVPGHGLASRERLECLGEGVLGQRPGGHRGDRRGRGSASTGMLRSRSGTNSEPGDAASTAAASAPRDWVSRTVSSSMPRAG